MEAAKVAIYFFIMTIMIAAVSSQSLNYTETYLWKGDLCVPNDTRKYISTGRIYVELPHNESRAIGVRVMPKVNVTLDCGYLIESLIGGIPRRVTSSRSTVWYYRRRLSSGSLSSTASIVATSSERHIYGMNSRYLHVTTKLNRYSQGRNSGEYMCKFCFDQLDFFTGLPLRRICNTSKADLNIKVTQLPYTERYFWRDGLTIPNDGRKHISAGRIYVEMPHMDSKLVDMRVRPNVNTTFDCLSLIGALIDIPLPDIAELRNTTWYHRRRLSNGALSNTTTIITNSSESFTFGEYGHYLRIKRSSFSSLARLGNAGLYTCQVCYDFIDPLTHTPIRTVCNSSAVDFNVIGDRPTIKRNAVYSLWARYSIGRTICMDNINRFTVIIQTICAQNHSISPIPTARYTLSGLSYPNTITSIVFYSQLSSEYGHNNAPYVLLSSLRSYGRRDVNLTCVLSNQFGSDTETTKFQYNVTSSFNASIDGVAGSQCTGKSANSTNIICPNVGQTVTLNCSTNQQNSYTISSGSRRVTNGVLRFTMTANDYGSYTCYSENDCNNVTQTITLEKPTDMCTDDDCKGEKEEFCTIDNGSYHCNCKKGYRIKISCEDIDECADPSLNNCTDEQECQNTLGGFKCLPITPK